ncbi:MAG TPA: hypothetical protein VNO21_08475 [Polyangiaceae bacterium]|nr:hypothetical protein [Polyangiaceae bacterium]
MPILTQLIKPYCLVIGTEFHDGLGIVPPPIPTPNKFTMWVSISTTVWLLGDKSSPTVKGHGPGIVKKGSDTKYLRPHICVGAPPPPSTVPPISDLGLIALHIAFGSAKTIWGPFSVKSKWEPPGPGVEDFTPAVIMIFPSLFLGQANELVCSSPCKWPSSFSIQPPNTVYAGMSLADIIGCLVLMAVDMLLDVILTLIFKIPFLDKFFKHLGEKLSEVVSEKVGRILMNRLGVRILEAMPQSIFSGIAKDGADEFFSDYMREGVSTIFEHVATDIIGETTENLVDTFGAGKVEKAADTAVEHRVEKAGEHGEEGHGEGEHGGGGAEHGAPHGEGAAGHAPEGGGEGPHE